MGVKIGVHIAALANPPVTFSGGEPRANTMHDILIDVSLIDRFYNELLGIYW